MAARNGNWDDEYADAPGWVRMLVAEIRQFIREGREDRKLAIADRKQAAEYQKQAAEDRKEAADDRKLFKFAIEASTESNRAIQAALILLVENSGRTLQVLDQHGRILQDLRKGQARQTELLEQISRSLKSQGNGRGGNGGARHP